MKRVLQSLALGLTAFSVAASNSQPVPVWVADTDLTGAADLDDTRPIDAHRFTIATTASTSGANGVVSGNLNFVAGLTFTGTGSPEVEVSVNGEIERVTLQSGAEITSSVNYPVWLEGCTEDQACSETVTVSVVLTPPLGGTVALTWRAAVQAAGSSGEAPPTGFDVTIVEQ